MIPQTPYAAFVAATVFEDIERVLDHPDCKTARHRVAARRQTYALRHERDCNPLNIRISRKGRIRRWIKITLIIALLAWGFMAFCAFVADVSETSSLRAQEGVPQQTTTPDFNPSFKYHPPEAP